MANACDQCTIMTNTILMEYGLQNTFNDRWETVCKRTTDPLAREVLLRRQSEKLWTPGWGLVYPLPSHIEGGAGGGRRPQQQQPAVSRAGAGRHGDALSHASSSGHDPRRRGDACSTSGRSCSLGDLRPSPALQHAGSGAARAIEVLVALGGKPPAPSASLSSLATTDRKSRAALNAARTRERRLRGDDL
eukprot:TRINITY_DN38100_c0_g1_i1.p1 TRINITY_DN38100_c0_g1~~TRINITY_DN38100_c0_g1_i1.p1  ORF type:complete len:190 (-),score=33.63 TRINITY_DN38100_c0_g1_i1:215-784(-)